MKHINTSRSFRSGLALLIALTLSACSSVTITQGQEEDFVTQPDFQVQKDFWLWGFLGEHTVNVREICKQLPVKQMQTQFTWEDFSTSVLSLGIYMPRSAKVWCLKPQQEEAKNG